MDTTNKLKDILIRADELKAQFDHFRPLPPELVKNLNEWFRIELTYTSNAIEGNTLTRSETALVVEKGITVKGKSVVEHLEAINHAEALDFIIGLVDKSHEDITKRDILDIHSLILKKIDDSNAGKYRNVVINVQGTTHSFPNPEKVPELMDGFFEWLQNKNSDHPIKVAADAHFKLVSIHPFADGNGRTARILMNLLLMQEGFPPAVIKAEDRLEYINAVEKGQKTGQLDDYYRVIYKAVARSLDVYLNAVEPKDSPKEEMGKEGDLLKIGELAKETRETVPTIRYWTQEGLLAITNYTAGGYWLYDPSMTNRVKEIRRLQSEKRLTLAEIKQQVGERS
jgi:Fic family protein